MAALTLNIDLSDPENGLKELNAAIKMVRKLAREKAEAEGTAKPKPPPKIAPKTPVVIKLGKRADTLFKSILSEIEKNGETNLEAVSKLPEWNCGTPSLRGTMMNAMRTVHAQGGDLPFHAEWNNLRGCMIYSAKVEA